MQHATLSAERWSRIPVEHQILAVANEMNRASKLFAADNRDRLTNCYERILRLVDLTIETRTKPGLRRELLRWRDLAAELYLSPDPDHEQHEAAFKALLLLHPVAARQIPFVLGGSR
jgi:hypothetical protein